MCSLSSGPLLLLSAGNTLTKQSFLSLSAPGTGRHTAVSSEELPELAPAGEMPPHPYLEAPAPPVEAKRGKDEARRGMCQGGTP